MKNLKMIWTFYRLVWIAAWLDEGTEEKELAEITRDAMDSLMIVRLVNSRIWVFWLFVLWALAPIATVRFIAGEFRKDLRKEFSS